MFAGMLDGVRDGECAVKAGRVRAVGQIRIVLALAVSGVEGGELKGIEHGSAVAGVAAVSGFDAVAYDPCDELHFFGPLGLGIDDTGEPEGLGVDVLGGSGSTRCGLSMTRERPRR
jgi:hypothetical protein